MQVFQHSDAHSFLNRAEKWLSTKETEHNIILAVAHLLTTDNHFRDPVYLATVERGEEVVGCVIRPPPDSLYVTHLPMESLAEIVEQLRSYYKSLPQLMGPELTATEFAKKWPLQKWKLHSRHRWYSLTQVQPLQRHAAGYLRPAKATDLVFLTDWAAAYAVEMDTRVDVIEVFKLMVKRGLLQLWDDDGPRCAITASGLTPNSARISTLYTPPEHRGRGYASTAVASISQQVLNTGRHLCVVAADVNDKVANRLYQRVGYRPGEEFVLIHFD